MVGVVGTGVANPLAMELAGPAWIGGAPPRFRAIGRRQIGRVRQLDGLSRDQLIELEVASAVLPFRVNDYVLDELIDWTDIPSDPIFQLTFPQAAMLDRADYFRLRGLLTKGVADDVIRHAVRKIHIRMNPHPAGQMELNVPVLNGVELSGCQHKYRETVLFFPARRADLPCLLYLLLPLAAVRRGRASQVRHERDRPSGCLPPRASRGNQRAFDRW